MLVPGPFVQGVRVSVPATGTITNPTHSTMQDAMRKVNFIPNRSSTFIYKRVSKLKMLSFSFACKSLIVCGVKSFRLSQAFSAKTAFQTVPGHFSEVSTTQGPVSVSSLDGVTLFWRERDCNNMHVVSGLGNGLWF